jgi:predicted Zn-dependent peptidase
LDRPEALAEHAATQLQVGRPTSLAARTAQITGVTREEVMAAAARWWRPEQLNVIAVGLASKAQRRTLQREYEAFQNLA